MKRLSCFVMGQAPNDDSYIKMYEGAMFDVFSNETVYESVYWYGEIGYRVERSKKNDPTCPTVTVMVPCDLLISEEVDGLKRLKYYFLHMQPKDETYKSIYEGKMMATLITSGGEPLEFPEEHAEAVYWENPGGIREGISYEYAQTHKLAKDCPTVKVRIPAEKLGNIPLPEHDEMTVHHAFSAQAAAAADFCLRAFGQKLAGLNAALYNRSRPDKENGAYYFPKPGGEVLVRNGAYFAMCQPKYYENGSGISVYIRDGDQEKCKPVLCLCLTLQVQLPQKKHEKAMRMLCRDLPAAVEEFVREFDAAGCCDAVALAETQTAIRSALRDSPYCAFIADGAILPRDSKTGGAMEGAIPFCAPEGTKIILAGIPGMGIRRGVTVITGGGYSGKSTVLDAIAEGVYNHVGGDGRELCITDETAVSIAAEDGRCVRNLNIAPFIKWLPGGNPADFSTVHASGSTSQAANIMEAVDSGARLLLIDEDRSATNFMIRDKLMKALIRREPITPFTDRVQELAGRDVSTILVIGGSGEYLAVADAVYMMDAYIMHDVTVQAKALASAHGIAHEIPAAAEWDAGRLVEKLNFSSYPENSGSERMEVSDMGYLILGREAVDLRGLQQLMSEGQRQAAGFILRYLMIREKEAAFSLSDRLDALMETLERDGLDSIYSSYFTSCGRFFDLPRKQDIIAVVHRMRQITYVRNDR
ncbi:MAG: hypothetical protein E7604_11140 [Ruminococcaceae bacterium]|nr:hypothetical protein [Oscillospiraceae bacterium]